MLRDTRIGNVSRLVNLSYDYPPAQNPNHNRASRNPAPRNLADPRKGTSPPVDFPKVPKRSRLFEDARYTFGRGGHDLLLIRSSIDRGLEQLVASTVPQFAIETESPLVVLKFRFGRSGPWENAPFAWHLQPAEDRLVPSEPAASEQIPIRIRLMMADDGFIYVDRSIVMSPPFARALHSAIRAQAASPFDPLAITRAIANIYLS